MRSIIHVSPVSLNDSLATSEGKSRYVRRLFATIADRYDFITVALSYGQDRGWKRRLVSLAHTSWVSTSPAG
jgi:ubiquinone/menaquinone biosynthesis C-methylase UbiE